MEEDSDQVLDDLRKKRLAYYGTLNPSHEDHNLTRERAPVISDTLPERNVHHKGERILSEDDILASERVLREKSMEWGHIGKVKSAATHNNVPTASNLKSDTTGSIEDDRRNQETREVKTTSFYFTNPESIPQLTTKFDNSEMKQTMPVLSHHKNLPADSSKTVDASGDAPKDGYNETVERLIRATKEELLGMKVSDDIWTSFKISSEAESVKETENPRSVTNEGFDHHRERSKSMQPLENSSFIPESVKETESLRSVTNEGFDHHRERSKSMQPLENSILGFPVETSKLDVQSELDRKQYHQRMPESSHHVPHTGTSDSNNTPANVHHVSFQNAPTFNKFEPPPQQYQEFHPQTSFNSEKVEEIFSSRQISKSQAFPPTSQHFQELEDPSKAHKLPVVHESLDLSELGLSTHRPEKEENIVEPTVEAEDLNLGNTVTKELRLLLGEEKFQQFLEKSKKDINDLHSDRSSTRIYTPKLVKDKAPLVARSLSTGSPVGKDVMLEKRKTSLTENKADSPKVENITPRSVSGRSRKTSTGDVREVKGNSSQEFTPRTPDGEAVSNMLEHYVLVKKEALSRALTSNPAYKQKQKPNKVDNSNKRSEKVVPELNLADVTKPDSPRPKLNRPKHEPPNIYPERQRNDSKGSSSDRQRNEGTEKPIDGQKKTSPQAGKNYEQITVPRNVTFSASEIYQQAYGGFPVGASGPMPFSPHYPSGISNQGMGLYMAPGAGMNAPMTPTTPMSSHSNISQTYMLNNQFSAMRSNMHPMEVPGHSFNQYTNMYPGDLESVGMKQFFARQSSIAADNMPMPHPPAQQPPHNMHAAYPQMMGQVPPEFQGFSAGVGPRFPGPGPTMSAGQPLHQQTPIFDSQRYQQTNMSAGFTNPAAGVPMGYPYPYPMMMVPPHPPAQGEAVHTSTDQPPPASVPSRQISVEKVETPPVAASSQVPDPEVEVKQDKATLVEESTFTSVSQIVRDDMMIPHPPPTKKEGGPSPRRHPKQSVNQLSQDSKRHIDGIRQHHEQRRQQQEETLSDEQILEKQRRFAKASLDRYFSSLENLYKPAHNTSQQAFLSPQASEDKEDEDSEAANDLSQYRQQLVKADRDIVDDVLSTICEDLMKKEADNAQADEVYQVESRDATEVGFNGLDEPESVADDNTEPVIEHGKKAAEVDNGTLVNTDVTGLSLDAGGVTDRLNDLGIVVTHDKTDESIEETIGKSFPVETGKRDKSPSRKGKGKEKKGKLLLICPECDGLNKEYMSWCTHCGEMIIGVEPMLVSKNREGKLRVKPVKNKDAAEENNTIKTVSNSDSILEQSVTTPSMINVNYEQEIAEKPFTLNLEGIKSPKKDAESKKSSPIKSDSRDSGRPSSDDRDNEIQNQKIEEEVVNDICETISDPVVKGYVKSHFNKTRQSIDGKSIKEKLQEDLVLSGLKEETDTRLMIHSKLNADKNVTDSKDEGIGIENKMHNINFAQPVINAQSNVQAKIALFNQSANNDQFNNVGTKTDYPVQLNSDSKTRLFEKRNTDDHQELVPPPLPHFSSTLPNAHNELALKLPANSMDYSTDCSQMGSVNFDAMKMLENNAEEMPAVEKTKAERRQERRNRRGHGAIDVEVFGIDEMRESRNSSRGQRLVPTLNFGNSSDEDDWSVASDVKSEPKFEPKLKMAPYQYNVSVPAWEPEVILEESTERESSRSTMEQLPLTPDKRELPDLESLQQPTLENHFVDVLQGTSGFGKQMQLGSSPVRAEPQPGTSGITSHKPNEAMQMGPGTSADVTMGTGMSGASGNQPGMGTVGAAADTNEEWREDNEDWKHLFDPVAEQEQEDEDVAEDHDEMEEADLDQPFLLQVINNKQTSVQGPVKSKRRPRSGKGRPVKSKVRQSLEENRYQRKWARSSTAWSSYNQSELNTSSSLRSSTDLGRERPASARVAAPDSSGTQESPTAASGNRPGKKLRPASADLYRRKVAKQKSKKKSNLGDDLDLELDLVSDMVEHRLPRPTMLDRLQYHMASPKSTYDKYIQMTPRIHAGTVSRWQCLPDEILIHVFAYLDQSTLTRCAQVCHQFYRVAMDESLWKYITIKKKSDLDDNCLAEIAKRHPVSLALLQCHGDKVTAKGLRDLFRECADTLKELNVARCSRGALSGDSLLLHAAARCHNLTHIDSSWCNVTDSGLMAISNTCNRLESLCINGCQAVSNDGFETVIKKHGSHLRVLEMFGCFNISPRGLRCIANNCIHLVSLNLGQCYKLTDSCIAQLSTSLGRVESLDLRGCKQIKDNCIRRVVKNCPRLKHLSLANCPSISDVSLLEISTYLTDIRSVDFCGCKNITDNSVRALANTCTNLRTIDISSTGCTQRSVSMIANFCGQRLELLKVNFLTDITEQSLIKLAKHCRKLTSVHLYGCTSVRNLDKVRDERPTFSLEM